MEIKIEENLTKSIEAEQYVISAILANNKLFDRVSHFLKSDCFSDSLYSSIYDLFCDLIPSGKNVDGFIATEKLSLNEEEKQLILGMSIKGMGISNVKDYAMLVLDRYKKRVIIDAVSESIDSLKDDVDFDLYSEISTALDSVNNLGEEEKEKDVFQEIEERIANRGKMMGLPTGMPTLDKHLDGWCKGNLYVVAGRSGHGKSALASFYCKVLLRKKYKSGIFSLEMKANQFRQRILSSFARINGDDIRKGNLSINDYENLIKYKDDLNYLYISDKPGVDINYIKTYARKWKKNGCDIIFIDYLGLIEHKGKKNSNLSQDIGNTTKTLKTIAKELDIAIVLLAQLNRDVEKRDNHRPKISDIKDSGSIEQDSDGIIFIYNPIKYLNDTKPAKNSEKYLQWLSDLENYKNKCEIILAKNRYGSEAIIDTHVEMEYMSFNEIDIDNEKRYV